MPKVFVIGAAALDITGVPDTVSRLRDSNIGRIRLSAGGVGHNIARALTAYDLDVELITALGRGYRSEIVERACRAEGIRLTHALRADEEGATYLSVLDEEHDMLVGISDMAILERLSLPFFQEKLAVLNEADFCVLDANLSGATLDFLTAGLTCPILYEPVSCAKAARIGSSIGRCYAVKPNRFEAAKISGKSCDTPRGVYRAAEWFLAQGVKKVFISMASDGVYWADAEGCGTIPAEPVRIVNTTGAGDAMCAAIVAGLLKGESTEACAQSGNHASALACSRNREEEL